ncbi:hypothetical protein EV127DRAFT_437280 [Xylaria flabelliformis]|nr:hypothetical protein EV127DRAFT_437280 [Xylaria flabelliformis]
MPYNPDYPYSLGLNIIVWTLQLPTCSFFLYYLVVNLPLLTPFIFGNGLAGLVLGICISATIFATLSTIVSDIIEIVKIARKRMPLALYIKYASKKTGFYALHLLAGLVYGARVWIIVGGIMSLTSFIQLVHGVTIGTRMRKDGIAMTQEYELILNPTDADHLEAGYNEAELSASSNNIAFVKSPPPMESFDSKL